jgi:hypothetical protein
MPGLSPRVYMGKHPDAVIAVKPGGPIPSAMIDH